MKKLFLILLSLFLSTSAWSQREWDESTKDAAFEAPNSTFCRQWEKTNGSEIYDFNSNGTYTHTIITHNSDYDLNFYIKYTGRWTRKGINFKLTPNKTTLSAKADPEGLNKLSARKRDEVNTFIAKVKPKVVQMLSESTCEILKLDKETFILAEWNSTLNLYNDMLPIYLRPKLSQEEKAKKEASIK